jgi:hypothetical protein
MVGTIERTIPSPVIARNLLDRFHRMVRHRKSGDLASWTTDAQPSQVATFVTGIVSDKASLQATLSEPWSNGQAYKHNTKLQSGETTMPNRTRLLRQIIWQTLRVAPDLQRNHTLRVDAFIGC